MKKMGRIGKNFGRIFLVGLLIIAAAVMAGCASYNPRTGIPDVKTFQETGIRVDTELGQIIAYPIQTKEDADVYFDNAALAGEGLLPVYVYVGNNQIDAIFIQINDSNIYPISPDIAYKLIKKSHGWKEVFWGSWTYFVGAPISAAHTASVNSKIEKDLKEKELKSGSGFLYFKISEDLESLDNYFLVVILRNSSKNITVKLPLRGGNHC